MAAPPVTIICPLFPPARGGLADHTTRLATELAATKPVTVLTSFREGARSAGVRVEPVVEEWTDAANLVATLVEKAPEGDLIWQYVPHMYGRGGVNQAVPRAMKTLRELGRHQVVIAHEIAGPLSIWPHRFWYGLLQRLQWSRIMRQADAIGISTEAWLEEWSRRTPAFGQKFRLLPSPATVPVAPIAPSFGLEWRTSQGWPASTQVMTFFGSVGRSKQIEWALEAWKQVQRPEHPVGLVLIGERPNVIVPVESARFLKALGFLPSEEVSRLLQVTDVLVLPFVDGVSERRTSFMAGLSHGRAVATTVGHNTGTTLRRAAFFAAADCRQRGEFVNIVSGLLADADRRSRLGAAARDAYARQYDWPTVVNSLAGMGSPGSQARP